jgi:hypothetical protein
MKKNYPLSTHYFRFISFEVHPKQKAKNTSKNGEHQCCCIQKEKSKIVYYSFLSCAQARPHSRDTHTHMIN